MGLWQHQLDGATFADGKRGVLFWWGMGCLAGETELQLLKNGTGFKISIKEFYETWNSSIKVTIKSHIDKQLSHSEIESVSYSGIKNVYKVLLESGREIKCTADHKIATAHNTWIMAKDLTYEHKILVNGQVICKECGHSDHRIISSSQALPENIGVCISCIQRGKKNHQYKTGKFIDDDGYVRLSGYQYHPRSNTKGQLYEHIAVMEKKIGRFVEENEIVHHDDEDRANNDPSNLILTNKHEHCSTKYHGNKIKYNFNGKQNKHGQTIYMIPKYDKLKKIEYVGQEKTYDITMKHSNNFVANGIVVHNSGKTYGTIHVIKKQGAEIILIVCPKSVIITWIKEIDKHAKDEFIVVAPTKGSVSKKTEQIKKAISYYRGKGKPIIVIVNYESCWRPGLGPVKDKYKNIRDNGLMKSITWDIIVADECHRLRSSNSKVSKFMAFLKSKLNLGLSGTPFSTPLSPFAVFRFLDKSIFSEILPTGKISASFQLYKLKYCIYGGFENRQVIEYINQDDLNEKIHSITHRIKTEDVIELPPYQHITVEVEMSPPAMKAYRLFKKEALLEFENGKELTAANVLVKHLRLAQIASGTIKDDDGNPHLIDNSKLLALKDLITGIDEPIVIFTRFRAEVVQIEEMINKFQREGEVHRTVCKIVGGCDEREKFASGEADIAIVNAASGGVGLNELAECNYSVYFSSGYDSLLYEQSLARTRRSGSIVAEKVFYYHIVAIGTIDETIMMAIEQKIDIVEAVLEDFKSSLAKN